MMYRPMDIAAKRMPARSIGVAWLPVDAKERTVGIDMTVPEKVGSGDLLSVPLKVTGLVAGEDARVVVAAVDVGILNVTGYEAPKPEGWYFAQRQIGVDIRDLYGRLIDGMRAERGTARSGGDGGGAGASLGSVDNVDSPLALYSGLQTVAADGTVTVDFTLPEFNGTVKLMAMAWTRDKLGHAEKDVTVRDAVAVTVANPRFMTFGDQAQILFDLHNVEGAGRRLQARRRPHLRERPDAAARRRGCHAEEGRAVAEGGQDRRLRHRPLPHRGFDHRPGRHRHRPQVRTRHQFAGQGHRPQYGEDGRGQRRQDHHRRQRARRLHRGPRAGQPVDGSDSRPRRPGPA